MNRRGFFGALVGGVAALATGKLLPEKKQNDLGKNAWNYADFFRPMNETERAYIEVDRLERRVQAVTSRLVVERPDWLSENCIWIHET